MFQTIPKRTYVRHILAYLDSVIGFIQTHFIGLTSFMEIPKAIRILHKASLLNDI